MELGICVHNAYAVNTVGTIMPEVKDQEVTVLFRGLKQWGVRWEWCEFLPVRIFLWPIHGATCKDDGVVAHVRGGERFSGQVRNPITEIIVMRREEDTLLAI